MQLPNLVGLMQITVEVWCTGVPKLIDSCPEHNICRPEEF